jgi:predicted TIM-barrel fold metal-dependent hydrolase
MLIDSHTHIFPPEVIANRAQFAARDPWFAELYGHERARMATAADLIASLDANGIDRAVTFGFGWRDPGVIRLANDAVIAAVQAYPDRLIGMAVIQPTDPATSGEIARCAAAGLRGIGELMPHGQGYRLSDSGLLAPVAEAAAALDLIVLTHASEPVGHRYPGKGDVTAADLLAFLAAFPQLRVIAAHWGGGLPFYHLMPEVAATAANCWFDSAASPYLYRPDVFAAVVASAGRDKILWASDFPLIGHKRMLAYTRPAGLDDATRAMTLGDNAAALFGITAS